MSASVEQKSPSSFTECYANICVTDVKYSENSCTEPIKQFLEGNALETAHGAVIQEDRASW